MWPTPVQIRAARTLLGWTLDDLAQRMGVGRKRLMRLEDPEQKTRVDGNLIRAVVETIEAAGVRFVPPDDQQGRGVRFRDPD